MIFLKRQNYRGKKTVDTKGLGVEADYKAAQGNLGGDGIIL